MSTSFSLLDSFDHEEFLKLYWQKKPYLIKQGLRDFSTLISPEELAELACEEEVCSRVITGDTENNNWDVKVGPFEPDFFAKRPDKSFTLLVERVDQLLPDISEMKSLFNFIPSWRFDDVMISYAEDNGSVGPHVDNYDVFLLQAHGRRKWQIESSPVLSEEDLLADCPVRILNSFEAKDEWVLEPGDILYLPPRWAHHGVSLGCGMTYSFGFRSPSHSDLLMGAEEYILQTKSEKDRYTDSDLQPRSHVAKIESKDVDRAKSQLIKMIEDENHHHLWFGRLVTTNNEFPDKEDLSEFHEFSVDAAMNLLQEGVGNLEISPDVKGAYFEGKDSLIVFIHGETTLIEKKHLGFIQALLEGDSLSLKKIRSSFDSAECKILAKWIHYGYFIHSDE